MRFGLLGLFLLLWASIATATELTLLDGEQWPLDLRGQAHVLEDTTGRLDLASVLALRSSSHDAFKLLDEMNAAPGSTRSAWWLELRIRNKSADSLPLEFVAGSHNVRQVDYYLEQSGRWTHRIAGEGVPLSRNFNSTRAPSLSFDLHANEQVRVLVRMQSDKPLKLNPQLYSAQSYDSAMRQSTLWDFLYFGGLGALGWCALAASFFARKLFLATIGLLAFSGLSYEFIHRGYAKLYLWPDAAEWAFRSANIFGHAGIALFILTFYCVSRQENVAVFARPYLLGLFLLQAAFSLASAVGDYYVVDQISPLMNVLTGAGLLAIAVVMKRRSVPTGGLMLLTMFLLMLRLALLGADRYGVLNGHPQTIGITHINHNSMLTLAGLAVNLTLIAAWISHVGNQRKAAQLALANWQEQEQFRLEKEVQRQTHALNQALQYANETNRKKTETLGYLSHDLRAPLTTIIAYAEQFAQTNDDTHKQPIQAIERSARYQLALIEDLLEYTKNELHPLELRPEPVSLDELLQDAAQFSTALSRRQNNQFKIDVKTELPAAVLLDGKRLQQVLLNLLANAAKFTHHGTIILSVGATPHPLGWTLQFSVSDTGVGISADAQSHIFGKYTQLQHHQGGVGLGLFIARQIVESMGGELRVESRPGEGSRFSFDINVAAADINKLEPNSLLYAPPSPQGNLQGGSGSATYRIPPGHVRVELAILARDGKLTDIENWLDQTSAAYPDYPAYFNELRAALQTLDFEYLEALALASEIQELVD